MGLARRIGLSGFFTLAFGGIVGSGWVIVLGDWLTRGGPGGATLGFLAGGAAMSLIGLCYAELAARLPRSGGEALYAREVLGPAAGFLVGWFLTLKAIGICAFEGIALGVLIRYIAPALIGSPAYSLLGEPVMVGGLAIGLVSALAIGLLNSRGASVAIAFQKVVTYTFIAIVLFAILAALTSGASANLTPVFPNTTSSVWWSGALWVFSLSGMFLNGFQAALHAIEERSDRASLRSSVVMMVFAIVAAAAFYCLLILSASSAVPWMALIKAPLPAAQAFSATPIGPALGTVVIVAAIISLIKTWNATTILASRLIYAQSHLGYLPAVLARISPRSGVPATAITVVTFISMLLIPLGQGAVLPIVNMCAMGLAMSYVLCVYILLKLRRAAVDAPAPAFRVPGGEPMIRGALVSAILMASVAFVTPAIRARGIPLEWILIATWGLGGAIVWPIVRKRQRRSQAAVS